jgi:hypothetical protein
MTGLRAVFLFAAMRSLLPAAAGYAWISVGGGSIMRSSGPQWVSLVLAVLALAVITCIAVPPTIIKQATALWGGG